MNCSFRILNIKLYCVLVVLFKSSPINFVINLNQENPFDYELFSQTEYNMGRHNFYIKFKI